jgi:hypothetical protein
VIAVLGDSVPSWLLTEAAAVPFTRKDVVIFNGSHEACDAMVNLPDGRDRRGDTLRPPADCAEWMTSYPTSIERDGTAAAVGLLMIGTAPILDRFVNDQWVGPCDGIDWYLADVAKRVEYLRSKNVIPVLAITSWPGPNSQFIYPSDYTKRVECVRDEMKAFALFEGISSFDLAPRLCASGPGSACDATRKDGVHVDSEVAPAVLDWVINQTLNVTSKERAQL